MENMKLCGVELTLLKKYLDLTDEIRESLAH